MFLSACASSAPPIEEMPSAEGYYQAALEKLEGEPVLLIFNDVDYPGAIEMFQEVIDNYPYSEYATLAELKIADVHFERENYEEAASFYQDFVELHPTNEQVSYAIYRNGLCSYMQMREPDQDQTATRDAIAQFQVLLERYPDSEMAPDAEARLAEAQDRLATADVAIGDYYFRIGHHYAAAERYRQALSDYPGHASHLETMSKLARSLTEIRRYYEAEEIYTFVLTQEPLDDDLRDEVVGQLEEIREGVPGYQPLPRSCVTDPNPSCAR